ncbi:uncharacterized protein LOC132302925 [Cornus florida]|uniref:uncharacterized protein LOC132302925 n=1 Tax=Cornus florida TaxID=4283 RepID=UPI00289AD91C|nr:uncharacterized protein LOC132302925 [Cornus florida]
MPCKENDIVQESMKAIFKMCKGVSKLPLAAQIIIYQAVASVGLTGAGALIGFAKHQLLQWFQKSDHDLKADDSDVVTKGNDLQENDSDVVTKSYMRCIRADILEAIQDTCVHLDRRLDNVEARQNRIEQNCAPTT